MDFTNGDEMVERDAAAPNFVLADESGSRVLVGEERARELRHRLEQRASGGSSTWSNIDFEGVEAASVPFLREFLAPLLTNPNSGPFVVSNASFDVAETLDLTLRQRGLVVAALPEGELYGGESGAREVFTFATKADSEIRAAEVASSLGISIQAANNRLKALLSAGALRRESVSPPHGGREFAYIAPGF
jgi:hypothetical protein